MDHDHNNTAKEINLFYTDVTHVLSLEQPPPPNPPPLPPKKTQNYKIPRLLENGVAMAVCNCLTFIKL